MLREDSDKPKEYCGLFGIANNKHASWLTYLGLYSLQHRGQEACGIVANCNGVLNVHKNTGLVSDVFNEGILKPKRSVAIGTALFDHRLEYFKKCPAFGGRLF